MTEPHYHNQPANQAPPQDAGGWTGYAAVKYGFIFLIVVAIMWFVANYVLGVFD